MARSRCWLIVGGCCVPERQQARPQEQQPEKLPWQGVPPQVGVVGEGDPDNRDDGHGDHELPGQRQHQAEDAGVKLCVYV